MSVSEATTAFSAGEWASQMSVRRRTLVREIIDAYGAAQGGVMTANLIAKTMTGSDCERLGGTDSCNLALEAELRKGARDGVYLMVRAGFVAVDLIRAEGGGGTLGQTLLAVAEAARDADRAIRFGEILPRLAATLNEADSTTLRDQLTRAIRRLLRTGALRSLGTVRGDSAIGRHLLVPRILAVEPTEWLPREPLTFLEYVAAQIHALTMAGSGNSAVNGPTFTSAELRARLKADATGSDPVACTRYRVDLADPMTVVLALQKLAAGQAPMIESVPNRRACWRLFDQGSGQVSRFGKTENVADAVGEFVVEPSVYACDTDRIIVAAKRAEFRLSGWGVTCEDVQAEVALDSSLKPLGRVAISSLLSDIARDVIDDGSGRRAARKARPIRRLGMREGRAVYWVAPPNGLTTALDVIAPDVCTFEDAQHRFQSSELRDAFDRGDYVRRTVEIEHAQSSAVAKGRARQLESELLPLYERANSVLLAEPADSEQATDADKTLALVAGTLETIRGWWRFRGEDAATALGDVCAPRMYTADELRTLLAPFSDTAAALDNDGAVKSLYWRAIRRLPNPSFKNRRASSRDQAHEFYFDACDAHLYLASQWGGPFTLLMSMEVRHELGDLRDPRYVLEGLRNADPRTRRRLIGSLGFLGNPDSAVIVESRARNDDDPTVRECALWALGLLRGEGAGGILREAAVSDPSRMVRESAARFLRTGAHWWYRV